MEHTINDMLQAKEALSQQISTLLNEFVDTYDIHNVDLFVRDERVIGQKVHYVALEVKYF